MEFFIYIININFTFYYKKIYDDRFNAVRFNIMPISIKHNKEEAICTKESKSILEHLEK